MERGQRITPPQVARLVQQAVDVPASRPGSKEGRDGFRPMSVTALAKKPKEGLGHLLTPGEAKEQRIIRDQTR